MSALTAAVQDGMVVTRRNLIKIKRIPDLLIFSSIQPIMFVLLFAYVFGGAIDIPGVDYKEYLMAGIFTQTVAFGGGLTAIGLADDMQKGIIDRFRSLPMARSAVLVGRTTSDLLNNVLVVVIMSICGLIVGWRIRDGVLNAIAAYVLLLAFSYALSWVFAVIGLSVRSVEVAQSAGFIWLFPLTFMSNAFVATASLPSVLQPVAEWNPLSAVVAATRELFGNQGRVPTDAAFPMQHPVLVSVFWIVLLLVIFVPLSVRAGLPRERRSQPVKGFASTISTAMSLPLGAV
jgi:ABC-2 type transport system permease protein